MEHIRAGRLRALAVTSETRTKALLDVPAMRDFVPGYEADAWGGIGAPKGTPDDIIERLNRAINAVLADPLAQTRLEELGGVPMPMTPAEFGRFIAVQTEKWGKVVSFSGAKAR
jgi:tripartite-type tricarboxylate transporter receptor subunit TctC